MKAGSKRWYNNESGELNASPTRGRVYARIESFPDSDRVVEIWRNLLGFAQGLQPMLPGMDLTHMLLLYYKDETGMGWHRDSDPNDGDNDHPIVSISLGNACSFESGDAVVWGGPQRMLEHCVAEIFPGTIPPHLRDLVPEGGRVNFTFRSARNTIGKEKDYDETFWVDPN